LFRLPVYHVENFLVDADIILEATRNMMGPKCPYSSSAEVEACLKELLFSETHLKPYTKALLDARVAKLAKDASDAVFKGESVAGASRPQFQDIEQDARKILEGYRGDGSWKARCKGRDLLRAYCHKHNLDYEHFRNIAVSKMSKPPAQLADIMKIILGQGIRSTSIVFG
jgi:hypothetical protein